MTVKKCVKDELRILAVVAYLPLIAQTVALLCQIQSDSVDAGAVIVK